MSDERTQTWIEVTWKGLPDCDVFTQTETSYDTSILNTELFAALTNEKLVIASEARA